MSGWIALAASFAFGAALAAAYLGALWLTVQRLPHRPHAAPWLVASFIARMGVVAAGFVYVASDGDWTRVLAALAGFVVVRMLVVARARRARSAGIAAGKEGLS